MGAQYPEFATTSVGTISYWVFTGVLGACALLFLWCSLYSSRKHVFFNISILTCLIGCLCYCTMALDYGWTWAHVEFGRKLDQPNKRQIFFVRYIMWFVSTGLLLLQLSLIIRTPWKIVGGILIADEIGVVCGLAGALIGRISKWGFFVFGGVFHAALVYYLFYAGTRHGRIHGTKTYATYKFCAWFLTLSWLLYPVCWVLCEGANILHPDYEAIFYGLLDVITMPLFGLAVVSMLPEQSEHAGIGSSRTSSSRL